MGSPSQRDLRVRCNDAVLSRIRLDNLELNSTHPTSRKESVAFTDGTVGLKEVWLQVHVKQVTAGRLSILSLKEHVDPLSAHFTSVHCGAKNRN